MRDRRRFLQIAASLGDADRLPLLGLIARHEMTSDELATGAGLDITTVREHLAILGKASLLSTRKDGHRRLLTLRQDTLTEFTDWCADELRTTTPLDESRGRIPATVRPFFEDGRLVSFPARQARKVEVLRILIEDFESGVEYREAEINQILLKRHPDFATLRRSLIDEGLMVRNGGVYRRTS